jgi:hypothetical protein
VLLSKDSGGAHTVAKLDAAGDLGVPVVIIARPDHTPVRTVSTVAEVAAWCRAGNNVCGDPRPRICDPWNDRLYEVVTETGGQRRGTRGCDVDIEWH